jgi:hypothetical protein
LIETRHIILSLARMVAAPFALAIVLILTAPIYAQDDSLTEVPPPVAVVPKPDRERLDAKADPKDRGKLALEMMNERLTSASKQLEGENYNGVFRELGVFHGLLITTIDFLVRRSESGKGLDNLKKFEMTLRTFMPRVETIRRELPSQFEGYLDKLEKAIRDARSKATEPMFSNNVVPNAKTDN